MWRRLTQPAATIGAVNRGEERLDTDSMDEPTRAVWYEIRVREAAR